MLIYDQFESGESRDHFFIIVSNVQVKRHKVNYIYAVHGICYKRLPPQSLIIHKPNTKQFNVMKKNTKLK